MLARIVASAVLTLHSPLDRRLRTLGLPRSEVGFGFTGAFMHPLLFGLMLCDFLRGQRPQPKKMLHVLRWNSGPVTKVNQSVVTGMAGHRCHCTIVLGYDVVQVPH